MHALIESVEANPAQGMTHWRVATTWQGGTHSRAQVDSFAIGGTNVPRRFSIDIDEPFELGGGNAFANPQEHLLAALNACMMVGYVGALRGARDHPRKAGDQDRRRHRSARLLRARSVGRARLRELRTRVVIKGDGTEEQFRKIHELVMATSPNFYNVTRAVAVVPSLIIE